MEDNSDSSLVLVSDRSDPRFGDIGSVVSYNMDLGLFGVVFDDGMYAAFPDGIGYLDNERPIRFYNKNREENGLDRLKEDYVQLGGSLEDFARQYYSLFRQRLQY
jgi:hypothetical protein